MKTKNLFSPTRLGPYTLKNRVVLPPLTRSRSSQPGDIPNELMAEYYAQRSSAGFMVTEGTQCVDPGDLQLTASGRLEESDAGSA